MSEPATDQDFCRAAARAADRPAFLAAVFHRIQATERLDWAALAHRLETTPEALCRIALCLRPRPASFRQDVVAIAGRFGADPDALAQAIRLADALGAIMDGAETGGLLAAARDADDGDAPKEPKP